MHVACVHARDESNAWVGLIDMDPEVALTIILYLSYFFSINIILNIHGKI